MTGKFLKTLELLQVEYKSWDSQTAETETLEEDIRKTPPQKNLLGKKILFTLIEHKSHKRFFFTFSLLLVLKIKMGDLLNETFYIW